MLGDRRGAERAAQELDMGKLVDGDADRGEGALAGRERHQRAAGHGALRAHSRGEARAQPLAADGTQVILGLKVFEVQGEVEYLHVGQPRGRHGWLARQAQPPCRQAAQRGGPGDPGAQALQGLPAIESARRGRVFVCPDIEHHVLTFKTYDSPGSRSRAGWATLPPVSDTDERRSRNARIGIFSGKDP
jgi:hypothetical protein